MIYSVEKEVDFATSLRAGPYRELQRRRRRRPLRPGAADPSAICLEDFAAYAAVERRAARLHGRAGDRPGRRHRRAGRATVDRGDRQRRHRRPALAPGGLRRHRRGLSGRARLPRPLRPARVLRESRPLLRRAEAAADAGARTSTPSAATARRCCISASTPRRRRAALAGVEGTGEIIGYRGIPTLASWGPLRDFRRQVGADRQDRHRRGLRADRPAASATCMIVGGLALLVVIADRRLAVALAARAAARAHRRRDAASPPATTTASVPVRTRDEIGQLCSAFNGMVDEICAEERRHREQEPRERGAAAERPAGADRQPPARRRAGHRRRLRRGHGGLRRPGRLHRACRRRCRRPRS